MNKPRNDPPIRRGESQTDSLEHQLHPEAGQPDAFTAEVADLASGSKPPIVPDSAIQGNKRGASPAIVGRTPYDLIVENSGDLSSALAAFVRGVRPIVILIVVAYVLLCIFARPSGPPMSFKALCTLLVGYDLLSKPLRKFFRRLITRS